MPSATRVHLGDPVAAADRLIARERRRERYFIRRKRSRRFRARLRLLDRRTNARDFVDAIFWTLVATALLALALEMVMR